MKVVYLKNFRKGLATNSSSTHTIIYKNKEDLFKDLNIFELNYYGRCTNTIAASREAKIKYVLANIFFNENLVKALSVRYPEMKQYFPLIKQRIEDIKKGEDNYIFGMCPRGLFTEPNNFGFSYDFCCDLIDDDEKIIIGGSDEQDFFYDQRDNHTEVHTLRNVEYNKRNSIIKNGNYYYAFGYCHNICQEQGKIRFSFNKENPIPEFPELVDLKITGMCNHNCPMCFEGSTANGKHADISYLESFINTASNNGKVIVEYSIGGGNILLYPELERLFKCIKDTNGYVNVTIKADDTDTVLSSTSLKNLFSKYVDGCGISVFNENDAKKARNFKNEINKDLESDNRFIYVVAHIIPEYIGFDMTMKIREIIKYDSSKDDAYDLYVPVLYLGYKELKRGKDKSWHKFTDDELSKIFENKNFSENIDTLFGQRYKEWISANFETDFCYTQNEGEYSVYMDAVNKKIYMSSYNLDKPYDFDHSWNVEDYKTVFNSIRKDNGFQTTDSIKHYWDS